MTPLLASSSPCSRSGRFARCGGGVIPEVTELVKAGFVVVVAVFLVVSRVF
jgi:hypothetical protein